VFSDNVTPSDDVLSLDLSRKKTSVSSKGSAVDDTLGLNNHDQGNNFSKTVLLIFCGGFVRKMKSVKSAVHFVNL